MRYRVDNNGILKKLSNVIVNPSFEEIDNFDNGVVWYEDNDNFLYNYLKIGNTNMLLKKVYKRPYLIFSSDSLFTLSASNPGPNPGWDGTIEYSLDEGNTWNTWDGSELSGTASQSIYLRGIGNTIITGDSSYIWTFTGKYVIGNIETLLDYQTVANGQHPTMGDSCYVYMFCNCTSLVIPPELPATTLASSCYQYMFYGCTSLTTAPELPATTLADYCYSLMFYNCTSLTTAPKLPATTLADYCYYCMFDSCTSIKLSTTQTEVYQYSYRIPTLNTGTDASSALSDMFTNTGGTFTGTPTINTMYFTDHQPV